MKRSLWLVSWYPSRVDKYNGDFIQRHANAVSAYCDVQVIYVVKDEKAARGVETESSDAGNLHEQIIYYRPFKTGIRYLDRFLSHRKYIRCYKQAVDEYMSRNGAPDLVHVHVAMKAGLVAQWVKKKWKIPFFLSEHWTGYYRESVPSLYDQHPVLQKMNRSVLEEALLLVAVTRDLGDTIKKNVIDIPFRVIPNVVNTDFFYYKSFDPPRFRFVHFSYMHYQKNPEGIINAAKQLKERGYDFELLMIGKDDEELIKSVKDVELLNSVIFFRGTVPYPAVAEQMQQSSAFVLFSRFENLPCVILEALCCGLPVISSNVGGIKEVINETNGILVSNGDTKQLADAMEQLIKNYASYNKKKIADAATKEFSYAVVGSQYAALYDNLQMR